MNTVIIIQKHQEIQDSESFKSSIKITESIPDGGNTKNIEITVPLKYLSNF